MFTITALQQSSIAQSIDIHSKLVIEVQGTSMHMNLHPCYNVFDCHWNRHVDSTAAVVMD